MTTGHALLQGMWQRGTVTKAVVQRRILRTLALAEQTGPVIPPRRAISWSS